MASMIYALRLSMLNLSEFSRGKTLKRLPQEGLVSVIQHINARFPGEYNPICRVYTIFEKRNGVARFMVQYGMENFTELVEVYLFLQRLRELIDVDFGWGPHIESLQAQPNYGRGEVIDDPKPKKRKRSVIEEREYAALIKLTEMVAYLENLVDSQLFKLEAQHEAFCLKADPIFAFKASATTQKEDQVNSGIPPAVRNNFFRHRGPSNFKGSVSSTVN